MKKARFATVFSLSFLYLRPGLIFAWLIARSEEMEEIRFRKDLSYFFFGICVRLTSLLSFSKPEAESFPFLVIRFALEYKMQNPSPSEGFLSESHTKNRGETKALQKRKDFRGGLNRFSRANNCNCKSSRSAFFSPFPSNLLCSVLDGNWTEEWSWE